MSRLNAIQYAKKYIDKENYGDVREVATRLFKKGFSVDEIANCYEISNMEAACYIAEISLEDALILIEAGWCIYSIARLGMTAEDKSVLAYWRSL